jgi:hypothetical protein
MIATSISSITSLKKNREDVALKITRLMRTHKEALFALELFGLFKRQLDGIMCHIENKNSL